MKKYNLPKGYSLIQSYLRSYKQVKDPIGAMEESMKKYNGTYAVNLGSKRLIATQDPGFIEYVLKTNHRNYHKSTILTQQLGRFLGKGLLSANGEYWLRQRRLIQPGFHMDKIQALYSIIKKTTDDFLQAFPTGNQVNLYPLMNSFAFEIVINTLFTIKVAPEIRKELNEFITETQDFVIRDLRQPHKSWWFELSGEVSRNLKRSRGARKIIQNIIRERRENEKGLEASSRARDLLNMLLDVRYEDTGEAMTEEQVIDEILILLIAGHETTANVLSWTLYLLASHPIELEELKKGTRGLTIQQCLTNEMLSSIIKESMRMYPPAWIADRVALENDAYLGYSFPKNTIIILFYYGLHRDENYWESPGKFMPQRFVEKEKIKAFYPFGAGPRLCIGSNFAMAEIAIFLQAFIQKFEIRTTGKIPELKPLITLRPDRVVLDIKEFNP